MDNKLKLAVVIGADAQGLNKALADSKKRLADFGAGVKEIGNRFTLGLTLPITAAAGAVLKFSGDLNAAMSDVATLLPNNVARVQELKQQVQGLAIATGKGTGDLAGGLYQVVSAFGDAADTAQKLEINAKAAVAGVATTLDAINLTSAVTKGYGDTSAAAVQQVADLAFQTVRLGQTTFPELASSIGTVVPLAASLGVQMRDLFGVMATATGVTGSASEVSTQFRGILQSLMAPTKEMAALIKGLGYASGEAMLKQLGLQGTINTIVEAAKRANQPLQSFIGSIEGQTLAMALAGPQAATFTEKLREMGSAAGAADQAFKDKTTGLGAAAFNFARVRQEVVVLAQKMGDELAPALSEVLSNLRPVLQMALEAVKAFTELSGGTQTAVFALLGIAAAAGPVMRGLSGVIGLVNGLNKGIGILMGAQALAGLGGALAVSGPVLVGLGLLAGAFIKAKVDALNAASAAERFREAISGISLDQLGHELKGFGEQLTVLETERAKIRAKYDAARRIDPAGTWTKKYKADLVEIDGRIAQWNMKLNTTWQRMKEIRTAAAATGKAAGTAGTETPPAAGGPDPLAGFDFGSLTGDGKRKKTPLELMQEQARNSLSVLNDMQRNGESFGKVWAGVEGMLRRVDAMIKALGGSTSSTAAELRDLRGQLQTGLFAGVKVPEVSLELSRTTPLGRSAAPEIQGVGSDITNIDLEDIELPLTVLQEAARRTSESLDRLVYENGVRVQQLAMQFTRPGQMLKEAGATIVQAGLDVAAQLSPLGMVSTLIGGAMEGLAPLMDALKEPLRMVGEILGNALAPILKALFPVFKLVAIAATYVGEIFFRISQGIASAIGWLIRAIGKVVDSLLPGDQSFITRAGQSLMDLGKAFGEGAGALKEGRKELEGLDWDDALKKVGDTANRVSEELTNMPQGFKIAQARFEATVLQAATPTARAAAMPTSTAPAPAPVVVNFHEGAIQVTESGSAVDTAREVARVFRDNLRTRTGEDARILEAALGGMYF